MTNKLTNKIFVKVDMDQKSSSRGLQTAPEFNVNYRENRPVLCQAMQDCAGVSKGDFLLVHHNFFFDGSPFQVTDNIFSIKINPNIFAKVDNNGEPHSIFGNVMAERIPIESALDLPAETYNMNRSVVRVVSGGAGFGKGQLIIHRPYCDYEIVYNWKGEERRVIKVANQDICGKILKKV